MNAMPIVETQPQSLSVSAKLLSVIEVFSAQEHALTLSEIARRTGMPLPTVYRFVGEWTAWGGLVRRADGKYILGTKLWEIGVQSPNLQILKNSAIPFLEDIVSETKQTAQLAILEGFDALYVEKIAARNSTVTISRVGNRLPLHATGVGLVFLAFAGNDFIDSYLSKPLRKFTSYTKTSPDEVRQRISDIRRMGLARAEQELHLGIYSVAVPVKDRTGRTIAAISAIVPADQKDDRSLELLVRAAGIGTSRLLGFKNTR